MAARKLTMKEADLVAWVIHQAHCWKGGIDPRDVDWYERRMAEMEELATKLRVEND